jgi:LysM repeat protein
MARSRNRVNSQVWVFGLLTVVGVAGYWSMFRAPAESEPAIVPIGKKEVPPLTTDRPEAAAQPSPADEVPERGSEPESKTKESRIDRQKGLSMLEAARSAIQRNEVVAARAQLNEALAADLPLQQRTEAQAELIKLAERTVFGSAITPNDPFVEAYVLQPGDLLSKVAKKFSITDDFLAAINGIKDKNHIRAGQRIKVVNGPFHARVSKDDFTIRVYLGDTLVKRFPVGLGSDNGTPTGTWRIKNKLENPQYHPPRGGDIILADDPRNPLGERWIGLEGVSGSAVGMMAYGIHGTIEPESIGKSVSMGCVRLHNADVEQLYDLLVIDKSQVTIE